MIGSFRQLGSLPKSLWILGLATLVNRMGTMALPFLALYLTQGQGLSVTKAGTVIAVYGIVAILVGPMAGRLSDKIGAAALMEISLLTSGAVMLLFPLAQDFNSIIVMTILWSLTSEAYRPAAMSLVGELVPDDKRKTAYAFFRLVINLGMSIGPAIGGFLVRVSYPAIFVVDGVTALVACVVLYFTRFRSQAQQSKKAYATLEVTGAEKPFRNFLFLFFMLASFPVSLVFFQHISTMPIFLVQDLKLTETDYGIFFAINTLMIIVFEIPLTAKISHWTYRKTLVLGALPFAFGFGALAYAQSFSAVALTVVVWTVGEMILFPASNAYVSQLAPEKYRGQYMGWFMASFSLAFVAAPWVGTYIFERYGGQQLWILSFFVALLSPVMFLMLRRFQKDFRLL